MSNHRMDAAQPQQQEGLSDTPSPSTAVTSCPRKTKSPLEKSLSADNAIPNHQIAENSADSQRHVSWCIDRTVVINYDMPKKSQKKKLSKRKQLVNKESKEASNDVEDDFCPESLSSSTDDSDEIFECAQLEAIREQDEQKAIVEENIRGESSIQMQATVCNIPTATSINGICDELAQTVCACKFIKNTESTEQHTQTKLVEQREQNVQTENQAMSSANSTGIDAKEPKKDASPTLKVKPSVVNGCKQRALELHRNRILVEQKRMDLLELKIAKERDEMLRATVLFEKEMELKNAQLRHLNEHVA